MQGSCGFDSHRLRPVPCFPGPPQSAHCGKSGRGRKGVNHADLPSAHGSGPDRGLRSGPDLVIAPEAPPLRGFLAWMLHSAVRLSMMSSPQDWLNPAYVVPRFWSHHMSRLEPIRHFSYPGACTRGTNGTSGISVAHTKGSTQVFFRFGYSHWRIPSSPERNTCGWIIFQKN